MLEQGKRVRRPPPEGQGVAEATCDEPTAVPIPRPPVHGRREMGVKLSPGRREGWGEGVLRSGFISHYPTLI